MKINSVDLTISAVRRSQYPTDNKPNNTMTLFVPIVNIFSQIFNRKK